VSEELSLAGRLLALFDHLGLAREHCAVGTKKA